MMLSVWMGHEKKSWDEKEFYIKSSRSWIVMMKQKKGLKLWQIFSSTTLDASLSPVRKDSIKVLFFQFGFYSRLGKAAQSLLIKVFCSVTEIYSLLISMKIKFESSSLNPGWTYMKYSLEECLEVVLIAHTFSTTLSFIFFPLKF